MSEENFMQGIIEGTVTRDDAPEPEVETTKATDGSPFVEASSSAEADPLTVSEHSRDEEPVMEAEEASEGDEGPMIEMIEDLMFGDDGEALAIPKGSKIKVKIDGEDALVDIQEVLNGISGQKALSRRFSELDRERKMLETEYGRRAELMQQMGSLMSQNKVVEALELAFVSEGYNPALAITGLFRQIAPFMEQYAQLPVEKRQEWVRDLDGKRQQLEYQSVQGKAARLQAERDQYMQIVNVQQNLGLDDGTYLALHNALVREREAGTMPGGNALPRPQDVAHYCGILKSEIAVKEAITQVNPEAAKDTRYISDLAAQIRDLQRRGYDITSDLIMDAARTYYGNLGQTNPQQLTKALQKKGAVPVQKAMKKANSRTGAPARHWMEGFMQDMDSANDETAVKEVFKKWDSTPPKGNLR